MTPPINKPTIQIFLYDLQEGLGQDNEAINQNRLKFWQRINKDITIKDIENYQAYEKPESTNLVSLGGETRKSFENNLLDGWYAPFQFGDNYILVISNCGDEKKENSLEKIKQQITNKFDIEKPTLGKTWLILRQLPANFSIEEIAKDCYTKIQPNYSENDKVKTAKPNQLLGGYLVEYWRPPQNWLSLDKETARKQTEILKEKAQLHTLENHHYLIWLFPNDIPTKDITDINQYLIRLLCHRHKIIWAYYQSRQLKDNLKQSYTQIEKIIATFIADKNKPQKMQQNLTTTLDILATFAVRLNQLFLQKRTVEINLESYKEQLQKLIKELPEGSPQPHLENFQQFSKLAKEKYLRQIESDYTSLSPGMTLLENLIKTIEGFNQIEQTRTEQNLTLTIGITGAALAASGVTATLISTQIPNPQPHTKEGISLTSAFFGSFSLVILFAFVIGGILAWRRPSTPKKPKNRS
ncbi:hypothetical protein NG798_21880 [Ancylothrix sp. C2]|uniref:hypothetical protein n=1 Tax=Ancylothrix sp. D3o TaxID=2953691 RepID=UPI0021BA52D5|nr:hypothetical protein [Ancylothrix sp. D3o]MCT7952447.1 hypothetical protein [Ancylothrix sp. D3o]